MLARKSSSLVRESKKHFLRNFSIVIRLWVSSRLPQFAIMKISARININAKPRHVAQVWSD